MGVGGCACVWKLAVSIPNTQLKNFKGLAPRQFFLRKVIILKINIHTGNDGSALEFFCMYYLNAIFNN